MRPTASRRGRAGENAPGWRTLWWSWRCFLYSFPGSVLASGRRAPYSEWAAGWIGLWCLRQPGREDAVHGLVLTVCVAPSVPALNPTGETTMETQMIETQQATKVVALAALAGLATLRRRR